VPDIEAETVGDNRLPRRRTKMGNKKLSIAAFGLALLCTAPSWAGSAGGVTGGPSVPVPATRYGFCYAIDSHDLYFSELFTYATGPKTGPNIFSSAFSVYILKTYRVRGDGHCNVDDAKVEASAEKEGVKKSRPGAHIIETNWQP
jgi:hypothetical protein